jgi:hypothetical protein
MFYIELLREKILKARKDNDDLTVFIYFWDLRKHVGEIDPRSGSEIIK